MPRAVLATVAVAIAALAAALTATPAAATSPPPFSPEPAHIAGRTVLQKGALIYTDYLYDAWGPDLDGHGNATPFPAAAAAQTSGDYRYDGLAGNDIADLREVRLTLNKGTLGGHISLASMPDAGAVQPTTAIDTDGDASTGAGVWPNGAGLVTPGADVFLTTDGAATRVTGPDGELIRFVPGAAVPSKARFTFRAPTKVIGELSPNARVWVGVGPVGADGKYAAPTPGATAIYDLAFQGQETFSIGSTWGDRSQAAALASGDLAPFAGKLKPRSLTAGRTSTPRLAPGFYNALFPSASDYGDGFATRAPVLGTPDPEFLDRWQPYGLYVPPSFKPGRPTPLLLALHSLQWNHNQYAATTPNLLTELGAERRSLIITPLARGTDTWYLDSGLADVLEAWDDVSSGIDGIRIDPERTSLFGYSMGGYGTYRLGLLMPDRFARAVTYVGPPAFVAWNPPNPPVVPDPRFRDASLTNPLVPNALNLPFEMTAGGSDTLVAQSGTKAQAASFAAAGNEYRFYFHPAASHFTFAADDVWDHSRAWLGSHRRVVDPRRVRYVRIPAFDLPDRACASTAPTGSTGSCPAIRLPPRGAPPPTSPRSRSAEPSGALVDEGTTELPAGASGSTAATVTGQHLSPRRGRRAEQRVRRGPDERRSAHPRHTRACGST